MKTRPFNPPRITQGDDQLTSSLSQPLADAYDALTRVLDMPAIVQNSHGGTMTIREATRIGSKVQFALRILDDKTEVSAVSVKINE